MGPPVTEGEVVALIGPNGAGKTTAFNAVTGYLRATSGTLRYRGKALGGMSSSQIAALGLVRTFQKTSVFAGRSALENVLVPYKLSENISLLRDKGFAHCEVFFKWYNFAGLVATKK